MMIQMVCGAYGAKGRLIRPADGPFSLSVEEEKRLVNRGVARYVGGAAGPSEPGSEGGQEENPESPQPEPEKPPKAKKPGKPKAEDAPPALSPEDVVV